MHKSEKKSFQEPEKVREFPDGRLELLQVGGATIARVILDPGWRWSTSVPSIRLNQDSTAPNFLYHVSGVLKVVTDDGSEFECRAGDVSLLPSGYDAWVVGQESVVVLDLQTLIDYGNSL